MFKDTIQTMIGVEFESQIVPRNKRHILEIEEKGINFYNKCLSIRENGQLYI